jgi:uncharacterized Zn finger protein
MSLHWQKCPYCGESTDTERVGKPLTVTTDKDGKLHVRVNKLKRCNYCGKTWRSELPTMKEAMGHDGEEETAF